MDAQESGRSAVARWGPLGAIVVVAVVVVAFLVTGGDDDGDDTAAPTTTTQDGAAAPPEGVLSFSRAEELSIIDDVDWGERCDTATGNLALPLAPPPECFAPFDGDNGGATETGVTGETIKVVVYTNQENDPVLDFIYAQVGNSDTPDGIYASFENFNDMFARYYETYGREVELVRYAATGNIGDETAATADAETIARDIEPFAVINGPLLTDAFADTLAANDVLCIACAPAQPSDWYIERAPYMWGIAQNAEQSQQMVAEYVGKRLAGRPAAHAGGDLQGNDRSIGYVYLSTGAVSEDLRERFEEHLADNGGELDEVVSYADPVALGAQARDIMARFKDRGITTVVFAGDPLAPQALTQAATAQDYFPEWVLGSTVLVDTTLFGRTYDQEQWSRAFGPSGLFARISANIAGAGYVYRWFYGEAPPAEQVALVAPPLQFLYAVLQGAGPDLTHQRFEDTIFGAAVIEGSVIAPQISWGDRGFWPATDYSGLDDQTEVFWVPDAEGEDELGSVGTGMWAYVDGGRRYLPGEWPEEDPAVFDMDGAVTFYEELPPGITLPDYEPLR